MNSVSKLLSGTAKPLVVTISLDNPQPTYTTLSALSGTVTILAPTTTAFTTIDITLEGSTSTYVERMTTQATNSRLMSKHTFLKLDMPIQASSYPPERTFVPGQVYKFPFNFAIPSQLLPRSCTHKCTSTHVHQAHLCLPPSMGNASHLAPEMARISYAIKAKVFKHGLESGFGSRNYEASLPLNIIPAVAEAPPMSVEAGDKDFSLIKTKVLKKGMFKGKQLGRITLKAQQPRDFMLTIPPTSSSPQELTSSSTTTSSASSLSANFSPYSSFSSDSDSNVSQTSQTPSTALTHLILTLNFTSDPSNPTAQPPRLSSLSSKLRSSTFFAARADNKFPLRSQLSDTFNPNCGLYETSMSLPSRNLESIQWVKNDPLDSSFLEVTTAPPLYEVNAPSIRRERRSSDSGYSTSSDREQDALKGKREATAVSYTAQISLPLSLPSEKTTTWLPSFHSCLVSRTYTLELSLSLTHGTIVPTTSLSLKVPIRIGVLATGERRGNGNGLLSSSGSRIREDASVSPLPPGYEVFSASGYGTAQRRTVAYPGGVMIDTLHASRDGTSISMGGQWVPSIGQMANQTR